MIALVDSDEMKGRDMQLAVLKVKKHRKDGKILWSRLQAAEMNLQGRKMLPITEGGELVGFRPTYVVPAFTRDYLIAESSDHSFLSDEVFEKFLSRLKWLGFTHFKWYDAIDKMEPVEI